MRSHLRLASTIGAAAFSVVAVAPATAAGLVSQSGANAVTLSVAGNGNGSGNVTATNDGTSERTSGDTAPPVSILKGQSLFNGGVLAQEATARADGTSAACAGLAGRGGSVAQVGDSACLTPGDHVSATLGSLDLSTLIVADPESALGQLDEVQQQALAPVQQPLTEAVNQAVAQVRDQFGDPGLVAGFTAVEGRCTAAPGSASGDATLADASITLVLPEGAPQPSVTLLDLPAHPKPNTHLTTNLSDVLDLIAEALKTNLNSSLDGRGEPLNAVIDAFQENIVKGVRDDLEKNLAPLEQNVLDLTLNRQVLGDRDSSIKVRALELAVLPAAKEQLGADLVNLQIGNAACGPSGQVAVVEAPAAAPAALPTAVSAGYATMPGQHPDRGDGGVNAIVLGAFAILTAAGAGALTLRRLRG